MNLLKDCFTENNGQWYCPVRITGIAAILIFLFLEIWEVIVRGKNFDAVSFGVAFASVMGVFTGSIAAKGRFLEGSPPGESNE